MTASASWRLSRSNLFMLGAGALAMVGVTAMRSGASSALPKTPPPPVVGIVNMETLINGLSELKERNEAVRGQGAEIQKRIDARKKEMEQLEDAIKVMAPKKDEKKTPAELRDIVDKRLKLAEMNATLEAEFKGAQQRIELQKGSTIRDLYVKALDTIEDFSKREGFDLVMIDDRSRNIPDLTTNAEMSAVIEGRRILYANSTIDITERVRVAMENEWAAKGKGKN